MDNNRVEVYFSSRRPWMSSETPFAGFTHTQATRPELETTFSFATYQTRLIIIIIYVLIGRSPTGGHVRRGSVVNYY